MIKGYWCFKVLPLVYDGSLSYYEVLCKIVDYMNHMIEDVRKMGGDVQHIGEEMGVLNLEIERLNNRCGDLEERVRLVENRCDNLEGGIRSVGQRIVNLFEIAETLSDDIVDLSNDIDAVNQKVPFAFGVDANDEYGYYKEGESSITPFGAGGANALSELTDVELSSLQDGQIIKYDSAEQKWVNSELRMLAPMIYSTKEREVGCWVDGKPLYAKSFIDTTTRSSGSNTLATGLSNIDTVIKIEGITSYGNNNKWLTIPFTDDPNSSVTNSQIKFSGFVKSSGNIVFYIGTDYASPNQINKMYITLFYTKSTDAPGSGHWTSAGETHHYSTNEQVVGTWIDGKPLYEKTIAIGMLPNNDWKTVNHGISNIKSIVSCSGYACRPATRTFMPIPFIGSFYVSVNASDTAIAIQTTSNASAFTESYVTLRYTKTTD